MLLHTSTEREWVLGEDVSSQYKAGMLQVFLFSIHFIPVQIFDPWNLCQDICELFMLDITQNINWDSLWSIFVDLSPFLSIVPRRGIFLWTLLSSQFSQSEPSHRSLTALTFVNSQMARMLVLTNERDFAILLCNTQAFISYTSATGRLQKTWCWSTSFMALTTMFGLTLWTVSVVLLKFHHPHCWILVLKMRVSKIFFKSRYFANNKKHYRQHHHHFWTTIINKQNHWQRKQSQLIFDSTSRKWLTSVLWAGEKERGGWTWGERGGEWKYNERCATWAEVSTAQL